MSPVSALARKAGNEVTTLVVAAPAAKEATIVPLFNTNPHVATDAEIKSYGYRALGHEDTRFDGILRACKNVKEDDVRYPFYAEAVEGKRMADYLKANVSQDEALTFLIEAAGKNESPAVQMRAMQFLAQTVVESKTDRVPEIIAALDENTSKPELEMVAHYTLGNVRAAMREAQLRKDQAAYRAKFDRS
jgi:hypothetical protein